MAKKIPEKEITEHDIVLELEKLALIMDKVLEVYTERLLNLEEFVESIYEYLKQENERGTFLIEQILKIRLLETPPKNRKHWRDVLSALDERIRGVEQYVSQYRDKKTENLGTEKTYEDTYI